MLKAVDPQATVDFSFEDDADPKTIFKLGHVDALLKAHIVDQSSKVSKGKNKKSPDVSVAPMRMTMEFARFGVKGWTNFPGEFKTEEVDVPGVGPRTVVSLESLNCLPFDRLTKLGEKVMELNEPSGDDLKN